MSSSDLTNEVGCPCGAAMEEIWCEAKTDGLERFYECPDCVQQFSIFSPEDYLANDEVPNPATVMEAIAARMEQIERFSSEWWLLLEQGARLVQATL